MCIKQREPAKNVLKKWKSIIDFFVSPNVVLHDGNGRTGRIILFRECLRHDISPFIIEDANRPEYLEALKAYRQNGTVTELTTLFQKEQEFYFNQCEYFFAE